VHLLNVGKGGHVTGTERFEKVAFKFATDTAVVGGSRTTGSFEGVGGVTKLVVVEDRKEVTVVLLEPERSFLVLAVAARTISLGNENFLVNEARGDAVSILVGLAVSLDEGLADFFLVKVGLVGGNVSDGNGGTHKTKLATRRGIILVLFLVQGRVVGVGGVHLVFSLVLWLGSAKVKVVVGCGGGDGGVDHGGGGQNGGKDQGANLHGGG
jgi:hypothetical protein